MSRTLFGVIAGLVFGAIDVALMLPMKFPDRQTAFAAAFSSRFAIGLMASTVSLPMPSWLRGAVVGLLISLPDAIVTKSYIPILISGIIGGTLIGVAASKWAV